MAALLLAPLGLLGYWGYVARVTHRPDGWFWIEKHRFHMTFDWGKSTIRVISNTFVDKPEPALSQLISLLRERDVTSAALFDLNGAPVGQVDVKSGATSGLKKPAAPSR